MTTYTIQLQTLGVDPVNRARGLKGTPQEIAAQVSASLEQHPYIDFADVMIMICRSSQGGYSAVDVRLACEVMGEVASAVEAGRAVSLSQEAYDWFCGRLDAFRWRMPHTHILTFIDAVKGAERAD